jgi:hypothetical protein
MEFAISLQFGSCDLFANAIAWLANTSGQIFLISNEPVLGCPKNRSGRIGRVEEGALSGNLEPD